jgi:hypothetical protein
LRASYGVKIKRTYAVAIYHLSVKTISRSAGRSATAAAAYRSGTKIHCEREGKTFDYTNKCGVENRWIHTPEYAPVWAADREQLWNAVELAETRKNSTVAREFEVALPDELDKYQRAQLVHSFVKEIVERHQCAVDVAIHEPSREGDERNHHAHILMSTRRIDHTGFTEKTRELDEKKSGEVVHWREQWANHCNQALELAGRAERVDHRSLEAQGIDREPTIHLGVEATALERRNKATNLGNENRETAARNQERLEENPLTLEQEIIASEQLLAELKYRKSVQDNTPKREPINAAKIVDDAQRAEIARIDALIAQDEAKRHADEAKQLEDENRARIAAIEWANAIIKSWNSAVAIEEQKIVKEVRDEIIEQMLTMKSTYEELQKNEPLFLGKEQWRKDIANLERQFAALKHQADVLSTGEKQDKRHWSDELKQRLKTEGTRKALLNNPSFRTSVERAIAIQDKEQKLRQDQERARQQEVRAKQKEAMEARLQEQKSKPSIGKQR